MIQDSAIATLALLKQDADLQALVDVRVWGEKLPEAEASVQARPNVVMRHAPVVAGVGGYLELQTTGFDLFCYGANPEQAKQVYLEVYRILKHARRQVIAETLLHSYDQVGGPRAYADPDIQWDCVLSSWRCLASENQVVNSQ